MAASQNGVYITQEIWHIIFFFDNCSMAKAESNKFFVIFCYVLNVFWFSYAGKTCQSQISFVIQPAQNSPKM
jgi:hypothetical protein